MSKPLAAHAARHLSQPGELLEGLRRRQLLYKAGESVAKIQKILRHQHATTTKDYLKSLGFQLEEIRESMEVLARGPGKVIPLHPKKTEAL